MKLKRLQMQGFKSFVDKTEVVFDQQIVCVVGPNGCGKSNIVDAIRWVMGEQSAKGLRGKDMADVIFAGTPARKPAGYAEVNLIFDNEGQQAPPPYTDFAEIMITRRLYRTGESEYRINGENARLKDINDLFLGTGSSAKAYSIVAQGKVDQIVLAKPEERRFLIEEAAGIAKYKVRKQSAERKMQSTQQNLDRVHDILRELERNAKSLERQVERAEKFREIQTRLRKLDLEVAAAKLSLLDAKASENDSRLSEQRESLATCSTQLSDVEARLEKIRLESLNQEKLTSSDFDRLVKLKDELGQLKTEKELGQQKEELLGNQIRERKEDIERLQTKSKDQDEVRFKIQDEIRDLEEERSKQEEGVKALKARVEEAEAAVQEKERALEESRNELTEIKTRVAKESQKIEMLKTELVNLEMERAGAEQSKEAAEQSLSETNTQAEEVQEKIKGLRQEREDTISTLESLDVQISDSQKQREASLQTKLELSERVAELKAQLEGLKNLDAQDQGIPTGAQEYRERGLGKLAFEQIRFKSDYEKLGKQLLFQLGNTIVGDGAEGLQARRRSIKALSDVSVCERNALSLCDEVESDELRKVLERIELVDEIDFSQTSSYAQFDLKGQWRASIGSSFYETCAGELGTQESPYERREQIARLQSDLQTADTDLTNELQKLSSTDSNIESLKQQRNSKSKRPAEITEELESEDQKLSELRSREASLKAERDSKQNSIEAIDKRIEEVGSSIKSIKPEERLSELERILEQSTKELQRLRARRSELDSTWVEKRIQFGALQERLERLQAQSVNVDMTQSEYAHNKSIFEKDIESWSEEIEKIKARRVEIDSLIEDTQKKLDELERSLAGAKETMARLHRELEEQEAQRKSSQTEKEKLAESVQELELERSNLKHQAEELSHILFERYQIELSEALEQASAEEVEKLTQDEIQLGKASEEAQVLRDRLAKFGDVNLLALKEFDEIKERLSFMNQQREDLLRTLESLQSIIDRINRITEFRFRETFKSINHNFQVLFPRLFGGGKAYMKLTNEEDLLETGVEIFAEPPGKKIQAMSLLSGGEKAMTSISLIFSLFAYRPSSFCILDEVDAPLDEINTKRYNEIIQEMSRLSQFIVITHNKRTMEVGSTLFGVTMQEPGCSKLVGVNLGEAKAFSGAA